MSQAFRDTSVANTYKYPFFIGSISKLFPVPLDKTAFPCYNTQAVVAQQEYGGIAQLGERLNGIQEVSGSIQLISTTES